MNDEAPAYILEAIKNNDTATLGKWFKEQSLEKKVGANAKCTLEYSDKTSDKGTLLHYAAMHKASKDTIDFLIKNGADVNAVTENRKITPLHLSCVRGEDNTVQTLLDHGADIRAKNDKGDTPLHRAAYNGQKSTVEVLLIHAENKSRPDLHEIKNDKGEVAADLVGKYKFCGDETTKSIKELLDPKSAAHAKMKQDAFFKEERENPNRAEARDHGYDPNAKINDPKVDFASHLYGDMRERSKQGIVICGKGAENKPEDVKIISSTLGGAGSDHEKTIKFQKSVGLNGDGDVGRFTVAALEAFKATEGKPEQERIQAAKDAIKKEAEQLVETGDKKREKRALGSIDATQLPEVAKVLKTALGK